MPAGGAFDIIDDLLARAPACSSRLSHRPLLGGYDEPETLSYQITLFGPIGADVRQDCMDGQMAKYRGVASRFGNYFDKVTDQIQIFFWFSAIAYAAYVQTQDVVAVFLAFTGVTFYSLRVYVKYVTIFIEIDHDKDYLEKASEEADAINDQKEETAGLGHGWMANIVWFIREQRKFFLFNEAVFVFLLSAALIFDAIMPMLWVFAVSQLYYGVVRSWQRGRQIYLNQHEELLNPMEK